MLLPVFVLAAGLGADCNANGVEDALDVAPGDLAFASGVVVPGDRPPPGTTALALADLNDDGRLDVAAASPFRVTVLLADPERALRGSQEILLGTPPVAIASADLDGDGDADLVTGNSLASSAVPDNVSIFLNRGDGSFGAPRNFAAGSFVSALVLADLDGDGDVDAATANASLGEDVSVFMNDGKGGFSSARGFRVFDYGLPCCIEAGDLDADGAVDLVTARHNTPDGIHILFHDGRGSFERVGGFPLGLHELPLSMQLTDWDGDGDLDVLTASRFGTGVDLSGGVTALANDGRGNLGPPWLLAATPSPLSAAIRVVGPHGTASVAIVQGLARVGFLAADAGQFGKVVEYVSPAPADRCAFADWDGDGRADLLVLDQDTGVVMLLGGEGGTLEAAETHSPAYQARTVLADFDGDGFSDVAAAGGPGEIMPPGFTLAS